MKATLHQAEKFKEMIGGKSKIKAGDLSEDLKQNLLMEFGKLGLDEDDLDDAKMVNSFLKEITTRQNKIAEEEAKIAKIKAENQAKIDKHLPEAKKLALAQYQKEMGTGPLPTLHEGGRIGAGGLANVAAGEVMFDNNAARILHHTVNTGMQLMKLQAAAGGGTPIIIQDNSVKSNQQTQPLILPPSPVLPGNHESPGNSLV